MPDAPQQPSSPRLLRALTATAVAPGCAAAAWLGLGSGAAFWAVVAAAAVLAMGGLAAFALPRASKLRLTGLSGAIGVVVALAAAGLHAAGGGQGNVIPKVLETVAFDVDAGVPLDPLADCRNELTAPTPLATGANPRIDRDGSYVWYDAPGPEGRRQIHRLALADGEPLCWTCREPGQNRRPALNPHGAGLLFETDRDGSAAIHAMETRLRGAEPRPSRRLTPGDGSSATPRYEPTGRGLAWSRMAGGRISVDVASMVSGHGGLILGLARPVFAGGAAWVAPLAWAADGRSLVVGRGAGPASLEALWIDPATGAERALGPVPSLAAADFSRDGRVLALLRSDRPSATPAALGFLLSRLPRSDPAPRGPITLWMGTPGDELEPVALGDLSSRRLTGLALGPFARTLVLAEREGDRELLYRADRLCKAL